MAAFASERTKRFSAPHCRYLTVSSLSAIQTGNSFGMQTLDQNLAELVKRNVISAAEARGKAKIPENFPG